MILNDFYNLQQSQNHWAFSTNKIEYSLPLNGLMYEDSSNFVTYQGCTVWEFMRAAQIDDMLIRKFWLMMIFVIILNKYTH